jgi:hypothetical protein
VLFCRVSIPPHLRVATPWRNHQKLEVNVRSPGAPVRPCELAGSQQLPRRHHPLKSAHRQLNVDQPTTHIQTMGEVVRQPIEESRHQGWKGAPC